MQAYRGEPRGYPPAVRLGPINPGKDGPFPHSLGAGCHWYRIRQEQPRSKGLAKPRLESDSGLESTRPPTTRRHGSVSRNQDPSASPALSPPSDLGSPLLFSFANASTAPARVRQADTLLP